MNWSGDQLLAKIATLVCGVEVQIIACTFADGDKTSHAYQAFISLLLAAVILSMFGAITGEFICGHSFHVDAYLVCTSFLSSNAHYVL